MVGGEALPGVCELVRTKGVGSGIRSRGMGHMRVTQIDRTV